MKDIAKTIKQLKELILDSNCRCMNLSNVKGYLGELLVFEKLTKEGLNISQKGNQAGHDLEINDIKIDVKFSTLKNEIKKFPKYWGWALKSKRKKRGVSCSHFVCISVDDNLNVKNYYAIKSKDLYRFDKYIKQFGNVENGFLLLPENCKIPKDSNKELKTYFNKCHKLVKQGIAKKVTPNNSLSKVLFQH